ncbi:MAG: class I SAM-dependent methyltransferase, partial [Candidatus Aenigmarchaeota archaeon]|nr:class I SAM-dependent methyltransferase [Candidatus Aenigmarchaeota archaeon]
METGYELKVHSLERDYWWFAARRDIVYRIIKQADRNSAILDIGCSGGILIELLRKEGFRKVYGIDT